jgi:hypothetical protein
LMPKASQTLRVPKNGRLMDRRAISRMSAQVLGRFPEGLVVPRAPGQAEKLALARQAQVSVVGLDAVPLYLNRPRQLFFNHSTPIFRRPICL